MSHNYQDQDQNVGCVSCLGIVMAMLTGRSQGKIQLPSRDCNYSSSLHPIQVSRSVTAIISPYHMGVRDVEVARGPDALINAGLLDALRDIGLVVHEVVLDPVDEYEGEVGRAFELHRRTSTAVTRAIENASFPLLLSGNSSPTVAVMAGIAASSVTGRGGDMPACLWFDAHDDYNVPDTIVSGYLDAMGIAMLEGEAWQTLLHTIPGFKPICIRDNLIHCGMRDVTEDQRDRVLKAGFPVVWGSTERKVDFAGRLCSLLDRRSPMPRAIHLDLDVLDLSVGRANKFAARGGLSKDDLVACLRMLPEKSLPLSLTMASYDPSCDPKGAIPKAATEAVIAFFRGLIDSGAVVPKFG